jgi:hypothetical protein
LKRVFGATTISVPGTSCTKKEIQVKAINNEGPKSHTTLFPDRTIENIEETSCNSPNLLVHLVLLACSNTCY